MKKLILISAALLILLITGACTPRQTRTSSETPGIESAVEQIIVTGSDIGERSVSVEEIKKLPSVEKEVVMVRKGGAQETFTVKGVLLADLLRTMGKDQSALGSIRLVAGDGYMIEVPSGILAVRDVILAYEKNGQPLEEEYRPLRIVILKSEECIG